MAVLNGGALTGLTLERKFGGRNELLTRFGPAPVSSSLATVHRIPGLMPTEIKI